MEILIALVVLLLGLAALIYGIRLVIAVPRSPGAIVGGILLVLVGLAVFIFGLNHVFA